MNSVDAIRENITDFDKRLAEIANKRRDATAEKEGGMKLRYTIEVDLADGFQTLAEAVEAVPFAGAIITAGTPEASIIDSETGERVQECEACERLIPDPNLVRYDADGVPLCEACWESLTE